ncbi:MAG: hypothetical protein ACK4PI_04895 [Tepidisphaerales bacterium]
MTAPSTSNPLTASGSADASGSSAATTPGVTAAAGPAAVDPARLAADSPYQRQRLWCGIVGIGGVLGVGWLAVLLGLPDLLAGLTATWPSAVAGAVAMLVAAVLASLVQAPVDYVAGRLVETRFRQVDLDSPYNWGRAYVARLLTWTATLTAAGAVAGAVMTALPTTWPVVLPVMLVGLAAVQLVLPFGPGPRVSPGIARRPWTEQLVAELKRHNLPVPALAYFDHGERSLAGGWAGFGPLKRLWVSSTLWDVPPRVAAALIARELTHDARGHRLLSLLATFAWVLLGCVFAGLLMPAAYRTAETPAAAIFFLAVWLSTWSWVSLLFVFPAMGRWQVLAADRGMLDAGFTLDESLTALRHLAASNRPDEELPDWIAFVFHPIPPMRRRREALLRAASANHGGSGRGRTAAKETA